MLDLSAAFDTIDHDILLDRLQQLVGVEGSALKWFGSYVRDRFQKVVINSSESELVRLKVGVPQGSVLGPLLFLIYILPLQHLIERHGVKYHGYADDTQLYLEFDPKSATGLSSAIETLERCVGTIKSWMICNKLQLNDAKTEVIIFASPYHHTRITALAPTFRIGSSTIEPRSKVKNLGVVMDSNLLMTHQLKAISSAMHHQMRQIRHIRHYLTTETCTQAVMTLVISRLDYANALLAGVSEAGLRRLQVAQNCAARLITGTPRSEHMTPVLGRLHWLPVHQRIVFKTLCVVYKCLHQQNMPSYLSILFVRYVPTRNLRSASSMQLQVQRTKNKYGDRCFDNWASKLWNSMPQNIQEAPSLYAFKKRLKSLLFLQYYKD